MVVVEHLKLVVDQVLKECCVSRGRALPVPRGAVSVEVTRRYAVPNLQDLVPQRPLGRSIGSVPAVPLKLRIHHPGRSPPVASPAQSQDLDVSFSLPREAVLSRHRLVRALASCR